MKATTLKDQIASFKNNDYLDSDGSLNSGCFNFYDWFCKDSSLENKAKKLFKQVIKFVKHIDVDQENTYVFFKNNCPMNGPLYDSFSICEIESGDVLWWVTGKSGHTGKAEIVKAPEFSTTWKEANTYSQLFK